MFAFQPTPKKKQLNKQKSPTSEIKVILYIFSDCF